MRKLPLTMAILLVVSTFLMITSASAEKKDSETNVLTGTWSDQPQFVPWSPMKEPKSFSEPGEAYIVDPSGKKTKVPLKNFISNKSINDGGIVQPNNFTIGNYYYVFYYYDSSTTLLDRKHYPIGSVSAYNNSPNSGVLSYSQATTKESSWSVSTSISSTAEFSVAFLAKLEATLTGGFSKTRTSSSTSTVSYTGTISPYKWGEIDAFHYGGYAGGAGVYRELNTLTGTFTGSLYYQLNQNGWAPSTTQTHYEFTQW